MKDYSTLLQERKPFGQALCKIFYLEVVWLNKFL